MNENFTPPFRTLVPLSTNSCWDTVMIGEVKPGYTFEYNEQYRDWCLDHRLIFDIDSQGWLNVIRNSEELSWNDCVNKYFNLSECDGLPQTIYTSKYPTVNSSYMDFNIHIARESGLPVNCCLSEDNNDNSRVEYKMTLFDSLKPYHFGKITNTGGGIYEWFVETDTCFISPPPNDSVLHEWCIYVKSRNYSINKRVKFYGFLTYDDLPNFKTIPWLDYFLVEQVDRSSLQAERVSKRIELNSE